VQAANARVAEEKRLASVKLKQEHEQKLAESGRLALIESKKRDAEDRAFRLQEEQDRKNKEATRSVRACGRARGRARGRAGAWRGGMAGSVVGGRACPPLGVVVDRCCLAARVP